MLSHSTTRAGATLRFFSRFLTWLLISALLLIGYIAFNTFTVPKWHRGEFGSDLRLLRTYYSAPQAPSESNHVIDMLRNGQFREFLRIHGLTNNNALFVLSHGKALSSSSATRYAYYPDDHVLTSARVPYFSARDLAEIIGPREAKTIHNIILAGCNLESAFDSAEIRKYFVNATNITHTPPGKNGYEFVFRHGLIYTSDGIKFFYQMPDSFKIGDFTQTSPAYQRKSGLGPYIAELFEPRKQKPFKTQLAGRELLGSPEAPQVLTAGTSAANPSPSTVSPLSVPLPTHLVSHVEQPDSKVKPIIIVRAEARKDLPQSANKQNSPAMRVPHLGLSFLGPWRELVLNALLALLFLKAGAHCLSVASISKC